MPLRTDLHIEVVGISPMTSLHDPHTPSQSYVNRLYFSNMLSSDGGLFLFVTMRN